MAQKSKLEVWGMAFEVSGYVVLLVVGLWQVGFTNRLDRAYYDWQYYIQEDVNLTVLSSLNYLAHAQMAKDDETKEFLIKHISETTDRTYLKVIEERNKKNSAFRYGQAYWLTVIKGSLLILAAVLLAIGKYLNFSGARPNPPLKSDTGDDEAARGG